MRWRMGVRNSAHTLASWPAVLEDAALRLASVSHPEYVSQWRNFLATSVAVVC